MDDTTSEIEIPQDFICPITQEIFVDPVRDRFGHHFERSAILEWLIVKGTCPLTRRPIKGCDFIPDTLLKTQISNWKRNNGYCSGQDENDISTSSADEDCSGIHHDGLEEEYGCRTTLVGLLPSGTAYEELFYQRVYDMAHTEEFQAAIVNRLNALSLPTAASSHQRGRRQRMSRSSRRNADSRTETHRRSTASLFSTKLGWKFPHFGGGGGGRRGNAPTN